MLLEHFKTAAHMPDADQAGNILMTILPVHVTHQYLLMMEL